MPDNPATRTLEALRDRHGERFRWLVMLTAMIGTMASIMSSTIVNVAVPDLSHYFTLGPAQAQWVSASFMIAMTLSMLLTPWLLARFGLYRTYAGAIVLLMLGGITGGLAGTFWLVLAMRVVEGLAAGVLQPIPSIIILRAFEPREQGRALGIFGFGVVLAPALGPTIGGFLVEHYGWRSIFFVVVPFCMAALVLARLYMPVRGQAPDRRGLDWVGLSLVTVAIVTLLNGLTSIQSADHALGVVLLLIGVTATAAFIYTQHRNPAPLMQMKLFTYPQFAMGALVSFIYGVGLFGSTYLLPVYMQVALPYGAGRAGLTLLPAGLALALVIPLGGKLADKYPAHILITSGLGVLAASLALMITVSAATPYLLLVAWVVMGRVGIGFIFSALSLGTLRGMEAELIAQASSAANFVRQLGGAIGVSATGIMLEWRLGAHAATAPGRSAAFNETFLTLAAVCALAMIAAWRMRPPPQDTETPSAAPAP
jgi:EmrB/QacA subfamily drug resistance transporter